MTGRGVHTSLVKGEKALEAVEIDALRGDVPLMQEARKDVQHDVLTGYDQLAFVLPPGMQQLALQLDALDRLHAPLMAGAGDIGVHIVLREAHLAADLIRVDFPPADQFVNRGFAHMQDLRDLLGGQAFVLCHEGFTSRLSMMYSLL